MPWPRGAGEVVLEYAIYWSPIEFVRALLELGANPNYGDHAGFPALLAALSTERSDKCELIRLLLCFGVDIEQRGLNDGTALDFAVAWGDADAIRLLLERGADPHTRTRIDDGFTALEGAERLGRTDIARLLRRYAPMSS